MSEQKKQSRFLEVCESAAASPHTLALGTKGREVLSAALFVARVRRRNDGEQASSWRQHGKSVSKV